MLWVLWEAELVNTKKAGWAMHTVACPLPSILVIILKGRWKSTAALASLLARSLNTLRQRQDLNPRCACVKACDPSFALHCYTCLLPSECVPSCYDRFLQGPP